MTARGFTLIEILVAIAIFTVVGVLAMGGYTQLVTQSEIANQRMQRVRAIQTAMLKLTQDFEQLEPRPVREPIGAGAQPALIARAGSEVEFTRAGWANPAGIGRPTLQRVRYSLQDNKLVREYHAALDAVLNDEPKKIELIDQVKSFRVEFLDAQQQWSPDWPRAGGQSSLRARPVAVKIELELDDWGAITRIVEVSNVAVN